MSEAPDTANYRFPRIHGLFLALIPLKTQVPNLVDSIKDCISALKDDTDGLDGFVYSAPGPERVSPGLAVKQGRAYLERWEDPSHTEGAYLKQHHANRVRSISTALDYFHQTNREWRRYVLAVRTAIDDAAEELDHGSAGLLNLPSIQIRLALDDVARAVPYDAESIFENPNWPDFEQAWADDLISKWPSLGLWMQRVRSIGHMNKPSNREGSKTPSNDAPRSSNTPADVLSAEPPISAFPGEPPHAAVESAPANKNPMENSGTATAGAAPPVPPLRVLSQSGQFWIVQFDGRKIHMKDSLGMRLLAVLLPSPNKQFSAGLLYRQATSSGPDSRVPDNAIDTGGFTIGDGPNVGSDDDRLDDRSKDELTAERDRLLLEAGRSGVQPDKAAEFRELADVIDKQLKADIDPLGRPRKLGGEAQKSRVNSVQQALKKLRTQLREEKEVAFADYLQDRLSTGKVVSFRPTSGELDWALV